MMSFTWGPFDRLPPPVQHLVLLMVPTLLGWTASDVVPVLAGHGPVAAVVAGLASLLILAVTPLTRTWGAGAGQE